ncbi:MAG: hypothetical protein A2X64_07515 [Ignavibacteria bacterium GWF2_33_9]|nr:MAG: hypothetical protein A2X64_07515 [Ignavibacteria bacterium GWF2_33_9]
MPTISMFYGIIIKMFFSDHNPPHFHAVYGKFNGIIDINTLELIEGDLPPRAIELIREWATLYKKELSHIWETQEFVKLPGLK